MEDNDKDDDNDNDNDNKNDKGNSALELDKDLGFSEGHQGHQPPPRHHHHNLIPLMPLRGCSFITLYEGGWVSQYMTV